MAVNKNSVWHKSLYCTFAHTCRPGAGHLVINVYIFILYVYTFFNIILFALAGRYFTNLVITETCVRSGLPCRLSHSSSPDPSFPSPWSLVSVVCWHCPSRDFIATAARVALKTNQRYKAHKYVYELKARACPWQGNGDCFTGISSSWANFVMIFHSAENSSLGYLAQIEIWGVRDYFDSIYTFIELSEN